MCFESSKCDFMGQELGLRKLRSLEGQGPRGKVRGRGGRGGSRPGHRRGPTSSPCRTDSASWLYQPAGSLCSGERER